MVCGTPVSTFLSVFPVTSREGKISHGAIIIHDFLVWLESHCFVGVVYCSFQENGNTQSLQKEWSVKT